jgi:chemotaxis response regulator CheB
MIKVLVVEDSPTAREMLVHLLNSDAAIQVIGTASDGEEALEFLKRKKPDVIPMDINMPKMNGLEATRRIMETAPTPIVIVQATWDAKETALTFRGVEAGALAVLQRPRGIGHPDHETSAKELVQTVKLKHGHRPSVSYLLRSVVDGFGPNAIGVLLTGMGNDGAEELKLMKEEGAVTIVQDKKSSVVYGMPGEALKLDAATYVLSPDRIAAVLRRGQFHPEAL